MDSHAILRDLRSDDLPYLRTWAADPEVVELWPDLAAVLDRLELRLKGEAESSRPGDFAITGSGGTPVGYAALAGVDWGERKATLDLVIGDKGWWDEERCAEATGPVLSVAFRQLELARLTAAASPLAPWLLGGLAICGFRRAGFFDQPYYTGGRVWRMVRLSLLREQYELVQRRRTGVGG